MLPATERLTATVSSSTQSWREMLPPLLCEELQAAREPRWPVVVVVALLTAVYWRLPAALTFGPPWLMPAICLPLLAAASWSHRTHHPRTNNLVGITLTSVITVFLLWSVGVLIEALLDKSEGAKTLLGSALVLWVCNCLVFSVWYWRLDAGGPHLRDVHRAGKRAMRRAREAASQDEDGDGEPDGPPIDGLPTVAELVQHTHQNVPHYRHAFLFPQMTMDDDLRHALGADEWTPQFIDYLFLSFNTSTALSPTDTAVLSRWAKLFMMVQAVVSLTIIALLAARAVNIL